MIYLECSSVEFRRDAATVKVTTALTQMRDKHA